MRGAKKTIPSRVREGVEMLSFPAHLEMCIGTTTLENLWAVSTQDEMAYDAAIPLLGIHPTGTHLHAKSHMATLPEALCS